MIHKNCKNIKWWLLSLGMIFGVTIGTAQTLPSINLDSCLNLALINYPLYKHAEFVQLKSEHSIKEINADMLPQFELKTEATYQSESTAFEIPGFPSIVTPQDNYSFGIQLNQVLYDFGKFNQAKAVERAQAQSDISKNEIDLYGLRQTIVQLYSRILLSKENIKILDSYSENIAVRYKDMESAVANGVVLQSNLDILFAEMQRTNQRLIDAQIDLLTAEQTLSLYTHTSFNAATNFTPISESDLYTIQKGIRPEMKMYDAQLQVLDEKKLLENRNKAPRLYAFGEGAYGRPGYDMLNEDLHLYGIVGIGLRWNLNNLYKNSIKAQKFTISKDMVQEQRSLFEIQQNTELIKQQNNIDRYSKLIESDAFILEKFTSVTATAADQLENGIITSTDYLTQLYAQKQAELNKQIHLIQLQLAVTEYNLAVGTN